MKIYTYYIYTGIYIISKTNSDNDFRLRTTNFVAQELLNTLSALRGKHEFCGKRNVVNWRSVLANKIKGFLFDI